MFVNWLTTGRVTDVQEMTVTSSFLSPFTDRFDPGTRRTSIRGGVYIRVAVLSSWHTLKYSDGVEMPTPSSCVFDIL